MLLARSLRRCAPYNYHSFDNTIHRIFACVKNSYRLKEIKLQRANLMKPTGRAFGRSTLNKPFSANNSLVFVLAGANTRTLQTTAAWPREERARWNEISQREYKKPLGVSLAVIFSAESSGRISNPLSVISKHVWEHRSGEQIRSMTAEFVISVIIGITWRSKKFAEFKKPNFRII